MLVKALIDNTQPRSRTLKWECAKMSSLTKIVLKIPVGKNPRTHTIFHTTHTISQQVQEEIKLQHFSPPPTSSSPSRLSLSQINASESGFRGISDVCVCVCEGVSRKEGGSLITRQGTLISDGNIWFTLSWRDSCIKSRNYPNQFKLHPPPSPPPCFTSLHIKLPH